MEPRSATLQADFLPAEPPGKPSPVRGCFNSVLLWWRSGLPESNFFPTWEVQVKIEIGMKTWGKMKTVKLFIKFISFDLLISLLRLSSWPWPQPASGIVRTLLRLWLHTPNHAHPPHFGGPATWHVGSLFPDQGLNLHPLHWKRGVLTTGLS